MDVEEEVIYGLSNGEKSVDLRWPLKVKGQGQTLKLWCQISRKRYEIERESVNEP